MNSPAYCTRPIRVIVELRGACSINVSKKLRIACHLLGNPSPGKPSCILDDPSSTHTTSTKAGIPHTGDRVGDAVGDVVGFDTVGLAEGLRVGDTLGDADGALVSDVGALVPHGVVWLTMRLNPAWPQCCPDTRMREATVDAHCEVSIAYLEAVALTAPRVLPVYDNDHQFAGRDALTFVKCTTRQPTALLVLTAFQGDPDRVHVHRMFRDGTPGVGSAC